MNFLGVLNKIIINYNSQIHASYQASNLSSWPYNFHLLKQSLYG